MLERLDYHIKLTGNFFQEIHNKIRPYDVELIRRDYVANGGWETFLSYEDPDQVQRGFFTFK